MFIECFPNVLYFVLQMCSKSKVLFPIKFTRQIGQFIHSNSDTIILRFCLIFFCCIFCIPIKPQKSTIQQIHLFVFVFLLFLRQTSNRYCNIVENIPFKKQGRISKVNTHNLIKKFQNLDYDFNVLFSPFTINYRFILFYFALI